jgi:hypothetical protein
MVAARERIVACKSLRQKDCWRVLQRFWILLFLSYKKDKQRERDKQVGECGEKQTSVVSKQQKEKGL